MNTQDAKRVLETALICSHRPLSLRDMRTLFADELGPDTVRALLDELAADWQGRGVELVALASGWRFQSRPELRETLDRLNPEKPPRYSRAAMETLAIIAYRQPVTRGDIEDIRGVTVSSQIVRQLEERGWIDAIGYREAPGRPALYATTPQFLDDLGLSGLEQLPLLDDQGAPPVAFADLLSAAAAPVSPELPAAAAATVSPEMPAAAAAPVSPELPAAAAATVSPEMPAAAAAPISPELPAAAAVTVAPEVLAFEDISATESEPARERPPSAEASPAASMEPQA